MLICAVVGVYNADKKTSQAEETKGQWSAQPYTGHIYIAYPSLKFQASLQKRGNIKFKEHFVVATFDKICYLPNYFVSNWENL